MRWEAFPKVSSSWVPSWWSISWQPTKSETFQLDMHCLNDDDDVCVSYTMYRYSDSVLPEDSSARRRRNADVVCVIWKKWRKKRCHIVPYEQHTETQNHQHVILTRSHRISLSISLSIHDGDTVSKHKNTKTLKTKRTKPSQRFLLIVFCVPFFLVFFVNS